MRFWFDTEFFEDGRTIELISIGIVGEDGRSYYAETPGSGELASSSDWLIVNVRPHLIGLSAVKSRQTIANEIIDFVGTAPEFWAYYADYDWVALCQLYGRMIDLPKGWPKYCRDVKQLCDYLGKKKSPKQKSQEHNALEDAKWVAMVWQQLQRFC